MATFSCDFVQKIAHALEEEEVDVYTLVLYSLNSDDLNYFNEVNKGKVKRIFKILIEDTRHHADLLKLIVEMGSKQWKEDSTKNFGVFGLTRC